MNAQKIQKVDLPSNWRAFHPRTYLNVEDLMNDKGGYTTFQLRTARVEAHKIENPKTFAKEDKLVVYFEKGEKGLILNATMCNTLQEISKSRNPADWSGQNVELYVELGAKTPSGRKDVLRIRAGRPPVIAPAA